jgi:hypothetical protein
MHAVNTTSAAPALRSRLTWFTFASPANFYRLAGVLAPVCGLAAVAFAVAGLWVGFFVAPTDAVQGEVYRIIFIHVPAAWMSMVLYVAMAFWAAHRLAAERAHGLHPRPRDRAHRRAVHGAGRCGRARCGAAPPGARGGCGTRGSRPS